MVFWVVLGVGTFPPAGGATAAPDTGLPPLLLFLLVASLQLFLRIVYVPRRTRRLYSQERNLQLPFESVCTERGIEWTNPNGRTQLPWSHVIRWKEGDTLSVLSQSDLVFNMVPKRCFAQPEQVEAFRSLLTERLGPPV